jgi:uncharacterized protein YbjT (DUF2867 family)
MAPILVTGATGNVGAGVVRGLLSAGAEVRAAVRPSGLHAAGPAPGGAQVVPFDFTAAPTWRAAFDGVRVLFLVRPPQVGNVRRDLLPAVAAAQRTGVEHVVFLSLQGAARNRVVLHATVEKWLRASGLSWTFVRPSFFMQNLSTTHRADIRDRSEIVVPAGRGRTAFVDADDVAAVAVEALLHPQQHAGRAWTPTGPAALTYGQVAETLSVVLGRPVRYARPGALRYARHARRRLEMPTGMTLVTTAIYSAARLGLAAGLTGDVRQVTGREPSSFRAFAERERDCWQPA